MSTTPQPQAPAEGVLTATVQFTVEQVQALYLTLSHGRSRPDEPEMRPAYGWMEPALVEAEKILEPWHSHFHDRQFNAMNRQFFGDGRMDSSVSPAPSTPAGQAPAPGQEPTLGSWYEAETVDDMQRFYRSRLPAIREAAREHGYAIGVHGSERRDFDLLAMPWRDGAADADTLAHAVAMAACGITRQGAYNWTKKPLGRIAVSIPVCWTKRRDVTNDGHIDLSVAPALATAQPAQEPAPAQEPQRGITLTGQQIKTALYWAVPDDDPDHLEAEVSIAWSDGVQSDDEEQAREPGYVLWWTDYPEEGCVPLDGVPPGASREFATPQPAQEPAEDALELDCDSTGGANG